MAFFLRKAQASRKLAASQRKAKARASFAEARAIGSTAICVRRYAYCDLREFRIARELLTLLAFYGGQSSNQGKFLHKKEQ